MKGTDVPLADPVAVKNDRRTIAAWSLYDWANSAFATAAVAVVLPAYFTVVVPEGGFPLFGRHFEADVLWGYLRGSAAFAFFLITPVLGAIADYSATKRRFLMAFAFGGSVFATLLYFVESGDVVLAIALFFLAQAGFVGANVFYDGFLPAITTPDTIDRVSARGYALGYCGGGLQLALALALVARPEVLGLDRLMATRLALASSGLWWFAFSLLALTPLPETGVARPLPSRLRRGPRALGYARLGFSRTWLTFSQLRAFPQLVLFFVAYMVYNDGVQTVNAMTATYATGTLGLGLPTIAVAFLLAQATAFPGALAFGYLAEKQDAKRAILLSLVLWSGIAIGAWRLEAASVRQFMMLAMAAGLAQGGNQALSRSLFGSMIPEEASAEFYGFYSVFSKFSAIWGPLLFAVVTQVTGSARYAILSVIVFFVVGAVLLAKVDIGAARASKDRWSLRLSENDVGSEP